jgi:hypothetical protein
VIDDRYLANLIACSQETGRVVDPASMADCRFGGSGSRLLAAYGDQNEHCAHRADSRTSSYLLFAEASPTHVTIESAAPILGVSAN